MPSAYTWLEGMEPRWVANVIQAAAHLILFVPPVFITVLLITVFFAMSALIDLEAARDYHQLGLISLVKLRQAP